MTELDQLKAQFETWFENTRFNKLTNKISLACSYNAAKESWQASAENSAKEIAKLKSTIVKLESGISQKYYEHDKNRNEQLAIKDLEIAKLREALQAARKPIADDCISFSILRHILIKIDEAISNPPTQSDLDAYRNSEPVGFIEERMLTRLTSVTSMYTLIHGTKGGEYTLPLYLSQPDQTAKIKELEAKVIDLQQALDAYMEDFLKDKNEFCECGAEHDDEETSFNQCKYCGKTVSNF